MKILALADEESRQFYEFYTPGRLDEFDLILACGDLKKEYLEFLVTMANKPLLYVPGNHDEAFVHAPPEGCVNLDGRVVTVGGVRFFGLGGAHRYHEGPYLYTQQEMARRARRARLQIARAGGLDVLVTHAPARGVNDMDTIAHQGFDCFNDLIARWQPRLFVHGHIHKSYGMNLPRETQVGSTRVINAFEHVVIEL